MPWIAIKLGLGMVSVDEVGALQSEIPYGRRMDVLMFHGTARFC